MEEGIDVEKCNCRHFSEVQKPRYARDLDLGSSESHNGHAQCVWDYQRAQRCDSILKQYGNMAI